MAEIIAMPKLGFDMAEGSLNRWILAEGDAVSKGDVLAEIETDKATVEVEASVSGIVLKHLVDEGAIVPDWGTDRCHRGSRRGGRSFRPDPGT